MVKVIIELDSAISAARDCLLGKIEIANDAATSVATNGKLGSYNCKLYQRGGKKIWKEVKVKDFDRKKLGAYDLLYLALKEAVGNRNE